MLVKPTVTDLLEKAENRYILVNIVSKRARQLVNGDQKLVNNDEYSKITQACFEVEEDKVYIKEND